MGNAAPYYFHGGKNWGVRAFQFVVFLLPYSALFCVVRIRPWVCLIALCFYSLLVWVVIGNGRGCACMGWLMDTHGDIIMN